MPVPTSANLVEALPEDSRGLIDFCRAYTRMEQSLSKSGNGDLVDEYGVIKSAVAELTAHEKNLKEELKRRFKKRSNPSGSSIEGKFYRVVYSLANSKRLNRGAIFGWMRRTFKGKGEAQINHTIDHYFTEETESERISVYGRSRDGA